MAKSLIALGIIPGRAEQEFENEQQQRRHAMLDTFNSLINLRRNVLMARYQDQNIAERDAERAYQDAPTRSGRVERVTKKAREFADAPDEVPDAGREASMAPGVR